MIDIRKITIDDLVFLNEVRNLYSEDYLHDSRRFTIDETINWYKKTNPDYYIILLNNIKIGYFRLSNYSVENKNIYVGADIAPEYKGLGLGKKSYNKFIPFLFNEYNLNKISLEVLSTNHVAISLYEKIGFKTDGVKREEVYKKGKWIDSIIMSILKKEYEKF